MSSQIIISNKNVISFSFLVCVLSLFKLKPIQMVESIKNLAAEYFPDSALEMGQV